MTDDRPRQGPLAPHRSLARGGPREEAGAGPARREEDGVLPLLAAAEAAEGFMPADEGRALYEAARAVAVPGPLLEVGSWMGKSALYLAAAARETGRQVVTVDHHRGSEEHQPGWEYHDPSLVDPHVGLVDTLPRFRRQVAEAGAEDVVVAIVTRSEILAPLWTAPLALLFLDGSHTEESARRDQDAWRRSASTGAWWPPATTRSCPAPAPCGCCGVSAEEGPRPRPPHSSRARGGALDEALTDERDAARAAIAALTGEFDAVVAASKASNADDEHDPEGATIAFERQQVAALLAAARRRLADADAALLRRAEGTYGRCETCGGDIGAERLAARPAARTCITCAR